MNIEEFRIVEQWGVFKVQRLFKNTETKYRIFGKNIITETLDYENITKHGDKIFLYDSQFGSISNFDLALDPFKTFGEANDFIIILLKQREPVYHKPLNHE